MNSLKLNTLRILSHVAISAIPTEEQKAIHKIKSYLETNNCTVNYLVQLPATLDTDRIRAYYNYLLKEFNNLKLSDTEKTLISFHLLAKIYSNSELIEILGVTQTNILNDVELQDNDEILSFTQSIADILYIKLDKFKYKVNKPKRNIRNKRK